MATLIQLSTTVLTVILELWRLSFECIYLDSCHACDVCVQVKGLYTALLWKPLRSGIESFMTAHPINRREGEERREGDGAVGVGGKRETNRTWTHHSSTVQQPSCWYKAWICCRIMTIPFCYLQLIEIILLKCRVIHRLLDPVLVCCLATCGAVTT